MSEAQSSAAENTTPSSPTPVAPKPAKPPMCSLCRVSKTEEHVASGWHAFNEKLFASGRMPIPETNYNLFGMFQPRAHHPVGTISPYA